MSLEEEPETCSVVVDLKPKGDWYDVCGKITSGKRLPLLDLAVCDEHSELFEIKEKEENKCQE